jgi:hypothetical protein
MKKDSVAGNIMQSVDYDSFRYLSFNRPINEEHVATLRGVIKKQGWLAPGLVWTNKDGIKYTVDGQHSKEACRLEGIPFRYTTMDEEPDINFLASLNSNRKSWKNPQYLSAHCLTGKKGYIEFSHFCKHQSISIENLLIILGIDTSSHASGIKNFQQGRHDSLFLKADWNKTATVAQQWKELSKVYGTTNKGLLRSMIRIQTLCPKYSHITMIVQCKAQPNSCKQFSKISELVPVLLNIYNHRLSKNKISI